MFRTAAHPVHETGVTRGQRRHGCPLRHGLVAGRDRQRCGRDGQCPIDVLDRVIGRRGAPGRDRIAAGHDMAVGRGGRREGRLGLQAGGCVAVDEAGVDGRQVGHSRTIDLGLVLGGNGERRGRDVESARRITDRVVRCRGARRGDRSNCRRGGSRWP